MIQKQNCERNAFYLNIFIVEIFSFVLLFDQYLFQSILRIIFMKSSESEFEIFCEPQQKFSFKPLFISWTVFTFLTISYGLVWIPSEVMNHKFSYSLDQNCVNFHEFWKINVFKTFLLDNKITNKVFEVMFWWHSMPHIFVILFYFKFWIRISDIEFQFNS